MLLNQEPIQHWEIKDLKGVGDVELSLDNSKRVFVFLGSNGVGKTKTLEALFLFFLAKNVLFNTNVKINSNLASSVMLGIEAITIDSLHFKWSQISEQISSKEIFTFSYMGSEQRSKITDPSKNVPNIGSIEERQRSYFSMIAKSLSAGTLKNLGGLVYLNEWFVSKAQASNTFQKESSESEREIYAILEALHAIDPRIGTTMQIDGDGNVYLNVEGQERKLTELSSGFISIVKLLQNIISSFGIMSIDVNILNAKGVVLIDEIESHLHVDWQTRIIPTLKSLFPNTTFYIATHSPLVLSQLEEGEAYLLKREDDDVVRSHMIDSPNKRILANVLRDAFGIDLNDFKRESMVESDQSLAKNRLLALLDENETGDTNNG